MMMSAFAALSVVLSCVAESQSLKQAVQSVSAADGCIEELSESEKRSVYPGQLWVRAKPFALPDLFLSESGNRITTREEWERVRRPEIRRWFETFRRRRRAPWRPW